MNSDTVKLLRECNAGIKMGENAIKKVLPKVKDKRLKRTLEIAKNTHAELGDKTHGMLIEAGADTKPPHAVASLMSDIKISVSLLMDDSDRRVASLMTDGCDMGIKSLYGCMNKYKSADKRSMEIAKEIIASEEYLEGGIREFL